MAETLERSVLENKDRTELFTIASALGLRPGGRSKKETLIDTILRGTGVAPEEAVPAKRGRPPKVAVDPVTRSAAPALFDPFADASAAPGLDDEDGLLAERSRQREFPRPRTSNGNGNANGNAPADGGSPRGSDSGTAAGVTTVPTPSELSDRAEAPNDRTDRGSAERRDFRDNRPESRGDRPDTRGDRNDSRGDRNRPGGNTGNGGSNGSNGSPLRTANEGAARFDSEGGGNRKKRRRRGRNGTGVEPVSPERDAAADRISETYDGELIEVTGILDISDQGFGYVRVKGYLPSAGDVYVPVNRVRQLGLRKGDIIIGGHRPPAPQEKFPAIVRIDKVNGHHPDVARLRPKFEDLTPLFPDVKLRLEQPGQPGNMTGRIIDLISPIGKGQRGLIVSPPKAGKTTIMKQIATSIEQNNPDVHLIVLLVDERPEEVTDMRRHVARGEVVASTFDRPSDEHTMVAEVAIERAKRLVEEQKDVVIILDGITRLARAYNLAAKSTGRIMSGGIDTGALYPPKKFFGAARNIEEGGSLTILATALIETGSTMDNVIFEEFKGTGNMELRLDRRLAEKRVYPAINVNESSTRREELLFTKPELEAVWKLRRVLQGLAEDGSAAKGLELLADRMKATRTNAEFLAEIARAPSVSG